MSALSSYDVVVIGAGHNGMVCALYLSRMGLKVIVVEAEQSTGGMARTTEPCLPGFLHNPHANYLFYNDIHPAIRDFGLHVHGLSTVVPIAQFGLPSRDGAPPVIFYRRDHAELTYASLCRHSREDAKLFATLKERADSLEPALAKAMYSIPSRESLAKLTDAVRTKFRDICDPRNLGIGTAYGLIEKMFKGVAVKVALAAMASELGAAIDEPGSDVAFLASTLWMIGRCQLPLGGMQSLSMALERAARAAGVYVAPGVEVARLHYHEDGIAGVETISHGIIKASIVVSSADLEQSLLKFPGKGNLPFSAIERIRAVEARIAPVIASTNICLLGVPHYKSAKFEPQIDQCFRVVLGFDSLDDLMRHNSDISQGIPPSPCGSVRINSLWDLAQAPAGHHAAGIDTSMPDSSLFSRSEIDLIEATYPDELLALWSAYAPNVGPISIATGMCPIRPYQRKMLLDIKGQQYRTPIDGYYVAGAGTYPGGGVHGACGYNAFSQIEADIALRREHIAS